MCRYLYHKKKCTLDKYYSTLIEQFPEHNLYNLPIDEDGYCIFHSKNKDWKHKNSFFRWFINLIYYQNNDENLKKIDLSGFNIIGMSENLINFLDFEEVFGAFRAKMQKSNFIRLIVLSELKINKPVDFSNSIFTDEVVIFRVNFSSKINLDNVIFKNSLTIKKCSFNRYVTFANRSIFEKSVNIQECLFAEYLNLEQAIFEHNISLLDCEFTELMMGNVSVGKNNDIKHWNKIQNSIFKKRLNLNNSVFYNSIAFTSCTFKNEVRFDNSSFHKEFNLVKPKIEDNIHFISSNRNESLFKTSANFLFGKEAFIGNGQIIFNNINLYLINPSFKENLRWLEINHKVNIQNCLRYRVSIEKVFNIKTLDYQILRDLGNVLENFFSNNYRTSLNIETIKDAVKNEVRIIYHTDDNISLEEFRRLILHCNEQLINLASGITKCITPSDKDNLIAFRSIIERYKVGVVQKLVYPNSLSDFFDDVLSNTTNSNKPVLSNKLLQIIVNNYKLNEMNIDNINIHGGQQQFADTIINNSNNLSQEDKEMLEVINQNVSTEKEKKELIKSIEIINSEVASKEDKSKAKKLLEHFIKEGVSGVGKEVAKKLLSGGTWEWLIQFIS